MDPWSAMQCASAVLGIVDFANNVLSLAYRAYTGSSSLQPTVEDLKAQLQMLHTLQNDARSTGIATRGPASQTETEIEKLYCMCETVIKDLIDTIGTICKHGDSGPTVWSSVKEAVKTLWTKKDIEERQAKLEGYQRQLPILVIAAYRSEHSASIADVENIREMVKGIAARLDLGASRNANIFTGNEDFTSDLLAQLYYREMENRYEAIHRVHNNTADWIFSRDNQNHNFVQWLEDQTPGSDLFWITGKPGSGKSTLMKFIVKSGDALDTSLGIWAGGRPILRLSAYFWISGAQMEKNQDGFLRRLLHQAVNEHKGLVSTVFTHRLRSYSLLGRLAWQDPWTVAELQQLVVRLIGIAQRTMKVAMFVDGLDEYDGKPDDILDLLDRIRHSTNPKGRPSNELKLCVASRPWTEFEAKFARKPNLRMEVLNGPDINKYVTDKLSNHPRYITPSLRNWLISEIKDKAQGVFLWAYLVTRMVTEALSKGDSSESLQTLINSLPSELGDLFENILGSLAQDPDGFRKASQILQIVLTTRGRYPAVMELFYALADPEEVFGLPVKALTNEERREKMDQIKWMVTAHTKCLLEVVHRSAYGNWSERRRFQFIHRSVSDYLRDPIILQKLKEGTKSTDKHPKIFRPLERLASAQLGRLKQCMLPGMEPLTEHEDRHYMLFTGIDYLVDLLEEDNDRHFRDRYLEAVTTAAAKALDQFHAGNQIPHTNFDSQQTNYPNSINTGSEISVVSSERGYAFIPTLETIRPGLQEVMAVDSERLNYLCLHNECWEAVLPLYISTRLALDGYLSAHLNTIPLSCREKWGIYLFAIAYTTSRYGPPVRNQVFEEQDFWFGKREYHKWLRVEDNHHSSDGLRKTPNGTGASQYPTDAGGNRSWVKTFFSCGCLTR